MGNMHLLPAADDSRHVADVIAERRAWLIVLALYLAWREAWSRVVEMWRDATALDVQGWPS